jgi:isohexenylglutaconyl-CoA hydratase
MSPTFETLLLALEPPFARITLNRPRVKNAMNYRMVEELIIALTWMRDQTQVRALVIDGADGTFCSGGDLDELRAAADTSGTDQIAQTARLDALLRLVNTLPQVVIACVEGAALGGGFGLVCVSDVAIASADARLGLPEVRLGLIPAVIAPYVIRRVGLTRARQIMLTGARFDGVAAADYGVVHEVLPANGLYVRLEGLLEELRHCAPNALRACKQLIFEVIDKPLDDTLRNRTALLNQLRASDEAREGMDAFTERRRARWAR